MLHLMPLLRPKQWVKNAFVAAPLFFGLELFDMASAAKIGVAVVIFCLLSSAAYIFNDLRDIESDRQHPKKRFRLLAAGGALQKEAAILAMALIAAGVTLGFLVKFPPGFYLYT
ncbi:MAG: UbiA family prenyltransferase, partial [Proteobacteria bacterium]|nr:UbiA family prenyltransferase [Pseudomonadota bacterium]